MSDLEQLRKDKGELNRKVSELISEFNNKWDVSVEFNKIEISLGRDVLMIDVIL